MKSFFKFCCTLLLIFESTYFVSAQDVYITIPTSSIFNRSEYSIVQNIMNTQGNSSWRAGGRNPNIRSTSGDYFSHTSLPNTFLPTSILQWRLSNIGGQIPPFRYNDVWPGYKWFTSSYQTWYQPSSSSSYNPGNIAFDFRVTSAQLAANAFYAGTYKIQIAQDYGRSGWYAIEFSPEIFNTFISIPEDIKWLVSSNSKYIEVSSLNEFRSSSSALLVGLGAMETGHTLDYNLFARSDKSQVRFTGLNGNNRNFSVSVLKLGSSNPKIATLPLAASWKNHSVAGGFKVIQGNRSDFELQLSVANADFKTHFFEAGTYTFQLKLDARSQNGPMNSEKEIDVTVFVNPLSEIVIPSAGNDVNFNFNTVQRYNTGQTITIPNQIKISNNEHFELYVKSQTNQFYSNGIQSNINASILEISVGGSPEKVALSTSAQKIMSNNSPVIDKKLNISYSISANGAQSLIPAEKKAYAISVIYSFTSL